MTERHPRMASKIAWQDNGRAKLSPFSEGGMPKYSLRSLIIASIVGPPALATLWWAWHAEALTGWIVAALILVALRRETEE